MTFLTERQKEILEFIETFTRERGVAPTHREICERFGFSSYGTVHKHLKLLAEKGFLRRDWNQKRGMELLPRAPAPPPAAAATGGTGEPALPFYGRIAAGRPIEAIAGDERLTVPRHLLGRRPGDHYVLEVKGDSMIGEGIHDGDLVVVLRRDAAEQGEMVVALVGGEATLKRFYPEGDEVRLQPSNPAMAPIRVPAADVRLQGVVVGLMRRY